MWEEGNKKTLPITQMAAEKLVYIANPRICLHFPLSLAVELGPC